MTLDFQIGARCFVAGLAPVDRALGREGARAGFAAGVALVFGAAMRDSAF